MYEKLQKEDTELKRTQQPQWTHQDQRTGHTDEPAEPQHFVLPKTNRGEGLRSREKGERWVCCSINQPLSICLSGLRRVHGGAKLPAADVFDRYSCAASQQGFRMVRMKEQAARMSHRSYIKSIAFHFRASL